MKLRWIEKNDLNDVLGIEHAQYSFHDPDFQVQSLQPWAWSMERWLEAVSTRRNKAAGTYDTRSMVAEIEQGPGEAILAGAMCWEVHEDEYEVIHLLAHPRAPEKVRRCLLGYLTERSWRSDKRKRVVMHVPDGDWTTLKAFSAMGWTIKRVPAYFEDGNDAWLCSFTTENATEKGKSDASFA